MTGDSVLPPLVPVDVDLRGFAFMPLDVMRLRLSELAASATAEEFRGAVLLWCAAWHQVPAASLPNIDSLLTGLAGMGRDWAGWDAVKEGALHGFVLCSDGRLYHPVIAEKALAAWDSRLKKQASAVARWGKRDATAMRPQCDGNAAAMQVESKKERTHSGKDSLQEGRDSVLAVEGKGANGKVVPILAGTTNNTRRGG